MRDRQREETRRRLYEAALEVFRRDGVANCRIDDIATRAAVSRAAFYFHFPTKDDVLLELQRSSREPIAKAIVDLPGSASIEQCLDTVAESLATFWQHEPRLIVDMATVSLRHMAVLNDREAEPVWVALAARFRRAAEGGELSDVLPPEVLCDFFLVNCLAAMVAWAGNPTMSLEVVMKGVAQLFLSGARPPAPAKGKR